MKNLFFSLLLGATSALAAMPIERSMAHESTPLQLGMDEVHSLYPKDWGVHGIRLNGYFVENRFMYGVDLGFWNVSEQAGGVQAALYGTQTHNFGGIQLAGWRTETKAVCGAQCAGMWNDAEELYGLQLTGVFGKARNVHGVQAALLSAVSESGTGREPMSGLQVGLWETQAETLNGVQLGGVFSESEHRANGIQLAALFAEAADTRGAQLSGLSARSKHARGFQVGGLMARTELEADGLLQGSALLAEAGQLDGGVQLAGLSANVIGESYGLQAGGLSTMAGSLNGWQCSLAWNYVFEHVNGVQLALLYNHAQSIRGIQIGLINHCTQLKGVQIGLINIVRETRRSTCPLLRIDF